MAAHPSSTTRALSALALIAGMAASPVSAQPIAQSPNAAEAAPTDDVGEITVTARRREESLLTTPVSATVLSGRNLVQQNIRNFQDLRGAVSNLELVPLLSGGTSFTIRGIGQTFNQVNSDTKAGFYVDEMYVSRQEGNDLYFYDVASLQVLKGPQGTLFGKNTTAGAVLLMTQRPTDRFEGYAQVRAGSFRRIDTEGALNVPLTDGIYARASFRTQSVRGYPSTMNRHNAHRLTVLALLGGDLLAEEGAPAELRESEIGRHRHCVSALTIRLIDQHPACLAQPTAYPPWLAPSSRTRLPWPSRARGARSRNLVCVVCRSLRRSRPPLEQVAQHKDPYSGYTDPRLATRPAARGSEGACSSLTGPSTVTGMDLVAYETTQLRTFERPLPLPKFGRSFTSMLPRRTLGKSTAFAHLTA
jgi:hypothetical protein